jgi:serine/threonine-protein kinase
MRTVTNASVPAGQAIGTEPPAGSQDSEGDTVVLRVSGGPGQAPVPDVTGKEQAAAQSELSRAGFTVNVTQQASDQTNKGFVISQAPAGGGRADRQSTVTIVVSTGPEKVTVPNIRRQGITSAQDQLKSVGLVLGNVSRRPNANFPAGTIIEQNPGPTARVAKGSSVSVVVATTPANVTVPSVIGNTATNAQTKLQNAGFQVTSDSAPSDQPAGVVIDQSPAAGTSVQPGRTINITVSLGPQGGTGTGTLPGTTTGASGQPPPP